MFIESPDTFLDDFSVPCVKGATSFTGLLDMPDIMFDVGSMPMQSSEYSLTFRMGDVSLATGDAVTVSGVQYTVRSPVNKLDDGVFGAVKLSKV
jgi:hypothetical protein